MAENSHISWTNHTFNPWIGCTKVSPACDGCYAAHLMGGGRYSRVVWGEPGKGNGTRDRTKDWSKPRRWNKQASDAPGETFVFTASLADVFDNEAPPEWRRDLFDLIRETPNLTWLLLTKRPGNIVKLFKAATSYDGGAEYLRALWPRNAAIGCTVVTQEEADRDIPKLLAAKAALQPAFAFLSMEPLLGPVDMKRWLPAGRLAKRALSDELFLAPNFYMTRCEHCGWVGSSELCGTDSFGDDSDVYCPACRRSILGDDYPGLDWVITGGETDQGAHKSRPADPDWYRSLRDQCTAAGVPFHHKQNGEWCQFGERGHLADGSMNFLGKPDHAPHGWARFGEGDDFRIVTRVGKERAGRLLDGEIHDARPVVSPLPL